MKNIKLLCRACAKLGVLRDFVTNENTVKAFFNLTGIPIINDGLPKCFCNKCLKLLDRFTQFRNEIIKNNELFLKYVAFPEATTTTDGEKTELQVQDKQTEESVLPMETILIMEECSLKTKNTFANKTGNTLANEIEDTVEIKIEDTFANEIEDTLANEIEDTVEIKIEDAFANEIEDTVVNKIGDTLANEIEDTVKIKIEDTFANEIENTVVNNEVEDTVVIVNEIEDTLANEIEDTFLNEIEDTFANEVEDTVVNQIGDTFANKTKDIFANKTEDTFANKTEDTFANKTKDTFTNKTKDTFANEIEDTFASENDSDIEFELESEEETNKTKEENKSATKARTPRNSIKVDPSKITTLVLGVEEQRERHRALADSDVYKSMPYKCERCYKGFNYERKLWTHIVKYHKVNSKFECDICSRTMCNADSLSHHKKRHTIVYQCNICRASFLDKPPAILHYQDIHEGISRNKYPCQYCAKIYAKLSTINAHIKRHHEIPKQQQQQQQQQLTRDDRPKCTKCNKTFVTRDSFDDHMHIHTGIKNYSCDVCGAKFRRRQSAKVHMLTHSRCARFICHYCGRGFSIRQSLEKHIARAHTSETETQTKTKSKDKGKVQSTRKGQTRTRTNSKRI